MKKFLLISILSLLIAACGKTVSKDNGEGLTITPPGVPKVPIAPNFSGSMTMNFTNYGDLDLNTHLETPWTFQENLLLTIPDSPYSISYISESIHNPITLKINNYYVCSYIWSEQKYVKHTSCLNEVIVQSGDEIVVFDIPQGGQTVTFKLLYQK